MVNFGSITVENCWRVSGTPSNFNGFRVLATLLHGILQQWASAKLCALNRGRHLYSAGQPSRWALAHILVLLFLPRPISAVADWMYTILLHMALVRIYNAGLKCAACGSLEMQDSKIHHLGTIAQFCRATPSQLRHVSTFGKKPVKQQYLLHVTW